MTEQEKLRRDIDTLRESIRLGWVDMDSKPLSPDERRKLRLVITGLVKDLAELIGRLDSLK